MSIKLQMVRSYGCSCDNILMNMYKCNINLHHLWYKNQRWNHVIVTIYGSYVSIKSIIVPHALAKVWDIKTHLSVCLSVCHENFNICISNPRWYARPIGIRQKRAVDVLKPNIMSSMIIKCYWCIYQWNQNKLHNHIIYVLFYFDNVKGEFLWGKDEKVLQIRPPAICALADRGNLHWSYVNAKQHMKDFINIHDILGPIR